MPLLLIGCASKTIPNIKFYAEIPFVDGPEGVYVESVTGKRGLIPADQWAKMRPTMIMLDPDGKKEAFLGWTEGCRLVGKQCDVQLKTAKSAVDIIDRITSTLIKK